MKFSIRDLLLLTLIVALAVGWWLDHQRRESDFKAMREELNRRQQVEQAEAWIMSHQSLGAMTNTKLPPTSRDDLIPMTR